MNRTIIIFSMSIILGFPPIKSYFVQLMTDFIDFIYIHMFYLFIFHQLQSLGSPGKVISCKTGDDSPLVFFSILGIKLQL